MNFIELVAALTLDPSKYNAGLTEAQKKAQSFGTTMSKVGGSLQRTGAIATAGITVPIVAMATSMVDNASDLNETLSKTTVVFGEHAARVIEFGESASKSMGMSQNEALAAAATYGNLFRAMEMAEETSADMSINLVGLAADLASFNNMDPTEVMDKLRAGLSGESEPLKSLGVNLNEAIIKEKAREMGLISGSGALDAASKAQATYALILEQTSLAQGDFARTSDGLANSQRIMKAELADASAKLGTQLLPLALKVVTFLSNLIDKFSAMSPAGQKAILIIGGIAAAIGPVITIIGTVMKVVGGLMTFLAGPAVAAIGAVIAPILPIIAIVVAVIAVIALLCAAWKNNWFGIRDITQNVIDGIVNFWNNKFLPAIKKVADFIGNVLSGAFNGVRNAIQGVIDFFGRLKDKLTNIQLPDWMTPGSPTPWEIGLRGVGSAMKELERNRVPGLSATLTGMGVQTGAVQGAGMQNNTNREINVIVHNPVGETTNQSVTRNLQQLAWLGTGAF